MLWQTITTIQKILLIALTQDPDTPPFSKEFQLRHRIGPSSSINASLTSLMKKGILSKTGRGSQYQFVDLFWVRLFYDDHHEQFYATSFVSCPIDCLI
jgi:hypothetical protein